MTAKTTERSRQRSATKDQSVLVTGVPGWLGTRLVKRLKAQQRHVRCLVYPGHWDASHLGRYPELDGTDVVVGDIRDPDCAADATRGIHTVFHLAGVRHPSRTRDLDSINIDGTRSIANAASTAGVSRFVHVSSISVHGHNLGADEPFEESRTPQPFTAYARSKMGSEAVVESMAASGKLDAVILRPGPFYGPAQSASMHRLMQLVSKKAAPNVDGSQYLRSFLHIDNAVDALLLAETCRASRAEPYLIADARPYSLHELVSTIADALSTPLRTWDIPRSAARLCETVGYWVPARTGINPASLTMAGEMGRHVFCSISRARTELGYEPHWSLNDGIRQAAAEFRRGIPGSDIR
ncbi:MAG: nucleoside-diphosphate-sugar epimerase [Myxococcota bacterium]|jgi:nucleoside-diphosphate-sugar epimerase